MKLKDFWVNSELSSHFLHYSIRGILYKLCGIKIGKHSAIHGGCYFSGSKFTMGDGSYLNRNCLMDCAHGSIEIGNNVGIAFNVSIYTTNHKSDNAEKRTGTVYGKNVTIGNGCWIGGSATICPGVNVGSGCIIAAGSVVVQDCEPNCIYGGNPAQLIKRI